MGSTATETTWHFDQADVSEPTWSKSYRNNTDVAYWIDNIDHKITPEIRRFLETYSKVPADEVTKHVCETRERAWSIRSYPCTGMGLWLKPIIPLGPAYPEIVSRLQQGATLVDIGCFMGGDLRRLVSDGAPSENLYAVDVVNHWDLGFDFFRDRDRFSAHFLTGDILHPGPALRALEGKIDVVNVSLVLHLWGYAQQLRAAENVCRLTRPGAIVVGFQAGLDGHNNLSVEGDDRVHAKDTFWQSRETWTEMWAEVGRRTGTRWECQVDLWEFGDLGWDDTALFYMGNHMKMLQFVVTRVA